jgi:D-alanine-D-alanine ligase
MVPYVGADVTGSAIGMDKDVSKRLMRDARIPVVPWETVTRKRWNENHESIRESLLEKLGLPLFVKPCSAGSSVGVKKIKDAAGFDSAVDFALQYDNKVLVEKAISAREIECSVLGNDNPEASTLGEVIPHHEFYSYEAKYIDRNGAELVIPADIQEDLIRRIRKTAVEAFSALNCSGMARIDFFVDKANGDYYINEINTLPGFTSISMYPKLWEISGLPYGRLLDRLIELAMERHSMKSGIITEPLNA